MPHGKLVTYKKLDGLADNTTLDISPFLKAALPWIEEVLIEESNRVLLHCAAGQSRSGAMLVGYIMWKNKMTLVDALSLVRSKRPIVQPNPGFLEQLKFFETNGFSLS
jgi:protein-tyrosine phosphatase